MRIVRVFMNPVQISRRNINPFQLVRAAFAVEA
jgi:hypothetical protein